MVFYRDSCPLLLLERYWHSRLKNKFETKISPMCVTIELSVSWQSFSLQQPCFVSVVVLTICDFNLEFLSLIITSQMPMTCPCPWFLWVIWGFWGHHRSFDQVHRVTWDLYMYRDASRDAYLCHALRIVWDTLTHEIYSDSLKFRGTTGEVNLEALPCDFEQLSK